MSKSHNDIPVGALVQTQGALFEDTVSPEFFGSSRVRLYPIEGDTMEPTFRRGDFAIVAPCDRYDYEGVYIIDDDHFMAIYRVERALGGMARLTVDNPLYPPILLPFGRFEEMIIGFVVGSIKIGDHRKLNAALAL